MKSITLLLVVGVGLCAFENTCRAEVPGSVYEPYTFTTVAGGGGTENHGSDDNTGTAARFAKPCGIAVDRAGNIYVADGANGTIRKITASGVVSTFAGTPNSQPGGGGSRDGTGSDARFDSPTGLAVDSAGNVYVGERGSSTIRKITPSAVVTTLAGLPYKGGISDGKGSAARFSRIHGITVDDAANVYVADEVGSIRKVTPDGVVSTIVAHTGSVDGSGKRAYVSSPTGIAVDSRGNIYVTELFLGIIRKVTPSGVVSDFAGLRSNAGAADGTGSAARFNRPLQLACDGAGNIYVTDWLNHTIRKITPSGIVTTLGGYPRSSGYSDGTGGEARFYDPNGIAVDAAGKLYIADSANHTIRAGVQAKAAKPIPTAVAATSKPTPTTTPVSGTAGDASELSTAIEDAEQEVRTGYNAIRRELSEADKREFDRDHAEWIKRKDAIADSAARLKFIQERIDGADTNPNMSVAEAERQLTGAYTTLRKMMSESQKQELKREQLPWIKRKDAINDPAARSVFIQERTNELSRRIEAVTNSSPPKE